MAVVATAMGVDVAALVAAATVVAAVAGIVQWQGQIVAVAAIVIVLFTRGGDVPRGDPNWRQSAKLWLFFAMYHVDLYLHRK